MTKKRILMLIGSLSLALMLVVPLAVGCAAPAPTPTPETWVDLFPDQLGVTTYPIGGGSHLQCAANLEAMFKTIGKRARVIPTATEAGRFWPLRTGEALVLYVAASAVYDAFNGVGETFSRDEWGPQTGLRTLAYASNSRFGWVAPVDSDIKTPADVKGYTIPFARGNASVGQFNDAALAYAGLTRADIKEEWYHTTDDVIRCLARGETDISTMWFSNPAAVELWMAQGFRNIPFPDVTEADHEAWERLIEIAPFIYPLTLIGQYNSPGASEDNPYIACGLANAYWCYDDLDEDIAYAFVRALHESYDIAKEIHPRCGEASLEAQLDKDWIGQLPWHPGAIRYFKEMDVWTPEWDELQAKKLAAIPK